MHSSLISSAAPCRRKSIVSSAQHFPCVINMRRPASSMWRGGRQHRSMRHTDRGTHYAPIWCLRCPICAHGPPTTHRNPHGHTAHRSPCFDLAPQHPAPVDSLTPSQRLPRQCVPVCGPCNRSRSGFTPQFSPRPIPSSRVWMLLHMCSPPFDSLMTTARVVPQIVSPSPAHNSHPHHPQSMASRLCFATLGPLTPYSIAHEMSRMARARVVTGLRPCVLGP
ncbi:hypothetical protein BDW22DRAFT_1101817 [Trametopsis cervina]|nr:hypothetical protein BDW22DRAFT_1101817 [Trametopsis cervina]